MTAGLNVSPPSPSEPVPDPGPEFEIIARIAHAKAGLMLPRDKAAMVYSRIAKRVKALRLASTAEYCAYVQRDDDPAEIQELISVLTTNVTSFFRERHHFDYLTEQILPDLAQAAARGERVRLWSAGSSSGEEAVSMAVALLSYSPAFARGDVRILATDIDRHILQTAQAALYLEPRLEGMPADTLDTYFERHDVAGGPRWRPRPQVRDMISFRHLNLMATWPFKGPFDVIFCRNVAIYFAADTQAELWRRFCQMLRPGGHIFIGHSERIEDPPALGLSPVHTTTYRLSPGRER